jgi:hypothetical protein
MHQDAGGQITVGTEGGLAVGIGDMQPSFAQPGKPSMQQAPCQPIEGAGRGGRG